MLNVKQITQDEALKLVTEGTEVMVMTPGTNGCDWKEMMPDTLQNLLSGLMYFRKEDPYAPAGTADEAAEDEETPPPSDIKENIGTDEEPADSKTECTSGSMDGSSRPRKRVKVDTGKLMALRKAGWSMKKIGEELGISESSVFNYLKKLKEGNQD